MWGGIRSFYGMHGPFEIPLGSGGRGGGGGLDQAEVVTWRRRVHSLTASAGPSVIRSFSSRHDGASLLTRPVRRFVTFVRSVYPTPPVSF